MSITAQKITTITTESQRVRLLPTTTQQASSSTQAAAGSSFVYHTPSPIGFGNPTSVLTVRDEGSRLKWNIKPAPRSNINSDRRTASEAATTAAALYYHHFSTTSTAAAASSVAIQSGWVFDLPAPFQGHQIFQKSIIKLHVIHIPQNKKVQYKYLSQKN